LRIALVISLLLSSTSAFADTLADCATIEADLDRLACYDRASGRTPVTAPTDTGSSGAWAFETEKSDFKDTTDVFLSTKTENDLSCGTFDRGPGQLILRCMENTTAAMLITSCHMASGFSGYGQVEYRVDDRPAKTRNFDESTDNSALGLWDGGSAIPFIKELIGGTTLIMRFTPFNESPTTARFDISGLESALEPLRNECGW